MASHVRYNIASPKVCAFNPSTAIKSNTNPNIAMKNSLKFALLIATMFFGTSVSCVLFTSCEQKPKTFGEKIDDALDARPHEKLKDAGEDLEGSRKMK